MVLICLYLSQPGFLSLGVSLRMCLRACWLFGIKVMMLDLSSKGCEFYSQPGRYQVVTTRTGDSLFFNSAFCPFGVGK